MALSRQVIVSDGTTKQYPISFADGYLSRDEVKVYEEFLDDTPDAEIPFTFINDYLIELSRVPVSGNKIVIERDVEASARKVIFLPEYIKSNDLNTMYKHLLYLAQAVLDGRWEGSIGVDLDMAGHRIINVGAPKDDNDAVRLIDISNYTNLAQSLLSQTQASQAAAKVSETNAKANEVSANASADRAQGIADAFDANAQQKTQEFNQNAQEKTDTFNTNAAQKQAAVDASAEEARKWAVGTIQERPEGSSKHWAEEAAASAASVDANTIKKIAYEGYRDINCSGAVTVVLKDTDESINLFISDNTTITYDCSQLSYPKGWATFQIHYGFSNGAKTVSHTNPLVYINGNIPDFSDGKWHWVVLRSNKSGADANNTLIMSDAGSEG